MSTHPIFKRLFYKYWKIKAKKTEKDIQGEIKTACINCRILFDNFKRIMHRIVYNFSMKEEKHPTLVQNKLNEKSIW